MNAIPELKPIAFSIVQRPAFDNTHLGQPLTWANDNAALLARYWHEQGQVLGLAPDDTTDFDFWLRVQHDIEVKS